MTKFLLRNNDSQKCDRYFETINFNDCKNSTNKEKKYIEKIIESLRIFLFEICINRINPVTFPLISNSCITTLHLLFIFINLKTL